VISVPVDAIEDVTRIVKEAMTFEWRDVPIVVDEPKNAGQNWSECYSQKK
jgi:hypothetical protein